MSPDALPKGWDLHGIPCAVAIRRLAADVQAWGGLPLPDGRTRAGRRLKARARELAEPIGVHWWVLLQAAKAELV